VKVLTVVGNRPQFVKSAPLSVALREAGIDEVVVHTGQHWDRGLSQIFFDELGLSEPQHRLDLHTADVSVMQGPLADVVAGERPDWVVVLGDTNSTLAGARAAAAHGVPVGHVEAGLRSGDLEMPEERNRIEVDALSALLFAPEEGSRATLEREGVGGEVEVVGDVMADASMRFAPLAREQHPREDAGHYVVATIHRQANVAQPRLGRIVGALNRLPEPVVFPAHPRTRAAIAAAALPLAPNVELVEPLGYFELAALASQARAIVTDSGGLQKEAYWYGVPCVTARPSTEWTATVDLGANVLVDDDPDALVAAVAAATPLPVDRPALYGDGHASERIAAALAARG
jgi:UDP-N-acetylglucosamine 2-epimerase (non-hydrolysing)/UDP-GlcNAc3NAcA epimerase